LKGQKTKHKFHRTKNKEKKAKLGISLPIGILLVVKEDCGRVEKEKDN
jgi:hypothetical protein